MSKPGVPQTTPCPICKKPALARPDNAAHPFCTARCQLIDLGGWLDGSYRIPGEPADVVPTEFDDNE